MNFHEAVELSERHKSGEELTDIELIQLTQYAVEKLIIEPVYEFLVEKNKEAIRAKLIEESKLSDSDGSSRAPMRSLHIYPVIDEVAKINIKIDLSKLEHALEETDV